MSGDSKNFGIDDVIITGELDRRTSRAPDYEGENRALNLLSEAMGNTPETVLSRVVELAKELTNADSAGISLLEPGGENGNFRWIATAGAWAPYRNGTMPRDASPCGTVMAREMVLLMKEPHRAFPALLQAEPSIGEGLLAPFLVAGRPAGTLWVIKHSTEGRFEAEDGRIIKSLAQFASAAHQMVFSLENAQTEKIAAAAQFGALFERMDQGFCVIEKVEATPGEASDFWYVRANPAFERHTGLRDVVGKTIREVVPDAEQSILSMYNEVVRTGEAQHFEAYVTALDLWMEADAFPSGSPGQLAVLFTNVSARKRAELALREIGERQAFMLQLSDALRPLGSPQDARTIACRMLGKKLGADRVYYVEYEVEPGHGVVADDFAQDGLPSLAGTYPFEAFQTTYEHLLGGKTWVQSNAAIDEQLAPDEREFFLAQKVVAWVDVPLLKSAQLRSILCVVQTVARDWTKAEVALIEEAAERLWEAIERTRAESTLHDSEARFRQYADASTNVLWIRDAATLQMIYVSPAFERIYGRTCSPDDGNTLRCWAKMIAPEDRKRVLGNFRRIRSGEHIDQEFRIHRASDGALRWIHNTDFPMRDGAGRIRWIAGIGMDATEARQASERQNVLVAELQHRTRNLIAVVRSLSSRTLENANSLEDFDERFAQRLGALSRVQGLLSHLATGERIMFHDLLRAELMAHGAADGMAEKVTLAGPTGVPLRSGSVQTLALALHELCTNAVKYGALRAPEGHLSIRWHVEPEAGSRPPRLHIEWLESGVEMPAPGAEPRGGGYGRELIERALPYQLQAKTHYEMGPDGVRCTINIPVSQAGSGAMSNE